MFWQVDKLFNPLTLLVGPCLVSYLIYKSTIPVSQGGYHLPWWYVAHLFVPPIFPHYFSFFKEHLGLVHGLAVSHTDGQTPPPPLVPPSRHHLRPRIHPLWILLCNHETIRLVYASRGASSPLVHFHLMNQTNTYRRGGAPARGSATRRLPLPRLTELRRRPHLGRISISRTG